MMKEGAALCCLFLCFLALEMLEDEPDQKEVDGDGYRINAHGSHLRAQTHPYKEIQEAHLEKVVHQMGSAESCPVLCCCFFTEDVTGTQVFLIQ